jgi:hypothetical protein
MSRKRQKTTVEGDGFVVGIEGGGEQDDDEPEGPCVSINKIKTEYARPEIACWGCQFNFMRPTHRGKQPKMDAMWDEYIRNKDNTSLEQVAEILEALHNKLFFEPSLAEGKPCLPWPAHVIAIHLTPSSNHLFDEETDVVSMIRDYSVIAEDLKQTLFVQTDNGRKPHLKRLEAYNKVNSEKIKLWQLYRNIHR